MHHQRSGPQRAGQSDPVTLSRIYYLLRSTKPRKPMTLPAGFLAPACIPNSEPAITQPAIAAGTVRIASGPLTAATGAITADATPKEAPNPEAPPMIAPAVCLPSSFLTWSPSNGIINIFGSMKQSIRFTNRINHTLFICQKICSARDGFAGIPLILTPFTLS